MELTHTVSGSERDFRQKPSGKKRQEADVIFILTVPLKVLSTRGEMKPQVVIMRS